MVLKKISTWVDAADLKKFVALAKKRKVKTAHLIREAMAEYLARK
jgi:hypothetical protein